MHSLCIMVFHSRSEGIKFCRERVIEPLQSRYHKMRKSVYLWSIARGESAAGRRPSPGASRRGMIRHGLFCSGGRNGSSTSGLPAGFRAMRRGLGKRRKAGGWAHGNFGVVRIRRAG